jgi:hypothetical protein
MKMPLNNREGQRGENRMEDAGRKGTREGESICRADSPEIGRETAKDDPNRGDPRSGGGERKSKTEDRKFSEGAQGRERSDEPGSVRARSSVGLFTERSSRMGKGVGRGPETVEGTSGGSGALREGSSPNLNERIGPKKPSFLTGETARI